MKPLAEIDLGDPKVKLPGRLGRYEILGRLGRGGMGVVLDALDPHGAAVALKLIRPQADEARQESLNARLLREARILQRIEHPGIVRLVESGEIEGVAFVAMEKVEGVTLYAVRKRAALELEAILSLGTQLTSALAHLHETGICHRDIKPGNVILRPDGRAVLADFGIARWEGATGITKAGEVVGSAGYLAPECFTGRAPNEQSDQYSLGVLLFEMAAVVPRPKIPKTTPLVERFIKLRDVDFSRFPQDSEWDATKNVLSRMLKPRPEDRYPSVRVCSEAFERLESETFLSVDEIEDWSEPSRAQPTLSEEASLPGVFDSRRPSVRSARMEVSLAALAVGLPKSNPWSHEPGFDDVSDEADDEIAKALKGRVSAKDRTLDESSEMTAVTGAHDANARTLLGVASPPLVRNNSGSAATIFEPDRGFEDEATRGDSQPLTAAKVSAPEIDPLERTELESVYRAREAALRAERPIEDSNATELEGEMSSSLVGRISEALSIRPKSNEPEPTKSREFRPNARVVKEVRAVREALERPHGRDDPAERKIVPVTETEAEVVSVGHGRSAKSWVLSISGGLVFGLGVAGVGVGVWGRLVGSERLMVPQIPLVAGAEVQTSRGHDPARAHQALEAALSAMHRYDFGLAEKELTACIAAEASADCYLWLGCLESLGGRPSLELIERGLELARKSAPKTVPLEVIGALEKLTTD